jgi:hypothetical protein
MPKNDQEPAPIDHIVRIFKASETATTSTIVSNCWEKAGFEYTKIDGVFHLLVHKGKVRESPEFLEVRSIDYLLEDPSG